MVKTLIFQCFHLIKIRKYSTELLKFVPKCSEVSEANIQLLRKFIDDSRKILVLTGAGISTESGKCYVLLSEFDKNKR